jgi:hypothetical protein
MIASKKNPIPRNKHNKAVRRKTKPLKKEMKKTTENGTISHAHGLAEST